MDAVVFSYFLGINLQVPYCILDDRFARFVNNCDLVQQTVNQDIVQVLTHSNLPIIRPSTINYLIYIFHTSFPNFAKEIIDTHADFRLALFYDTNSYHTEFIQTKIQQFIPYQLTITILNPLDSFSLTKLDETYDLIIGNLTLLQKNVFHYADINLTSNDLAFIARQIQEKGFGCCKKRVRNKTSKSRNLAIFRGFVIYLLFNFVHYAMAGRFAGDTELLSQSY